MGWHGRPGRLGKLENFRMAVLLFQTVLMDHRYTGPQQSGKSRLQKSISKNVRLIGLRSKIKVIAQMHFNDTQGLK